MIKTYIYIPEETYLRIKAVAKKHNVKKADVLRVVLEEGVSAVEKRKDQIPSMRRYNETEKFVADGRIDS
jgi:predicted DNA-binding protein